MRRHAMVAAVVASLWTGAAPAQTLREIGGDPAAVRALVGRPVFSADGVRFGHVEAIVLDRASKRVLAALIRYGGFLGAFETEVLVPAEQVAAVNTDSLVLLWSATDVEAAPPVDGEQLAGSPTLLRVE